MKGKNDNKDFSEVWEVVWRNGKAVAAFPMKSFAQDWINSGLRWRADDTIARRKISFKGLEHGYPPTQV